METTVELMEEESWTPIKVISVLRSAADEKALYSMLSYVCQYSAMERETNLAAGMRLALEKAANARGG